MSWRCTSPLAASQVLSAVPIVHPAPGAIQSTGGHWRFLLEDVEAVRLRLGRDGEHARISANSKDASEGKSMQVLGPSTTGHWSPEGLQDHASTSPTRGRELCSRMKRWFAEPGSHWMMGQEKP